MTKFLNNADIKGYIAQTAVTSYLLKADSTGRLVAAIAGTDYQAPTTALLPSGGTAGQILAKIDGTNYNAQWIDNFAQQIKYDVKLGAALSKGTPVYVSSANGTNIIVSASSNATEATSSKTLGLLETGGALNDIVKVVSDGLLSGLNTSTATIGDPVWLGVNGALIFGLANKPSAPAHLVYIGAVTRVHATNGEIFIKVQNGFELDELHNVALSSVADGQGLFYESATSLWKNKTIASVLGYTPANDSTVVHLAGTETITGVKTFSSVINASTLSLNGGTLAGNNIVSMRSNPTGGQFRIEKSDGSLSAYPFYIGVDGTALAYYYNAAGALKVLLHTNDTSYFGNSLSIGYATYASTSYMLDVNGTVRFAGVLSGTIANFTNTSGDTLVLSKGSGPSIQFSKTDVTAQSWGLTGEGTAFKLYNYTAGTIPFQIAISGAATFSSSIAAGGIVTAPSQFQLSGSSLPTGLNLGVGGNTPLLEFHANFRNSQNTTYRGGELRIDTRDGQSLFSFLSRAAGSTVDNFLLSLSEAGQLKLTTYTSATSYSGTAAGYLAFDSSGNVITVAGVAATDNTKLPLAGGTTTGIVTFGGSNNSTDNVRFQNTDGNYAYIRQTAASNSNNVWYDGTLGATMWYAWDNPGSARTANVYTQHTFGTGRGTSNEAVTINRGAISGTNSSGTTTYSISRDGSASLAGGITFTAPGGSILLKHAVSEVDAWIFQENATNWGLYWKNAPTGQHTFGGYTSVGAELVGMSAANASGNGILTSNFVGATSAYAQWMMSNYTGYIWSASTIYAVGDMRTPVFRFTNSTNNAYLTGNSDWGFRVVNDSGYIQFGPANPSWAHIYSGLPFYFNQQLYVNGTQVVTNSGTWGINITGNANNITQYTINQSLGTGNGPTFADVYINGWFRNNANNTGLYSQANNIHFYANTAGYWNVTAGGRASGGIKFFQDHETTLKGYVYWDGSGFGLLNNQGGWSVLAYQGASYGGELRGTWSMGGNTILTNSNYSSYALARGGDNTSSVIRFTTNNGGYNGSLSSASLQVYSDSNNAAYMSFHKGGYYAVNFGLDADNVMRIGGWSASSNRWQLDMSGNQTIAGTYYGSGAGLTGTASSLSVNYASTANQAYSLPTSYVGGQQLNPQVYFNSGVGLKVAMTASWGYWSDTMWVNGYGGGDVPWMCALHFQRNSQPRMAISAQQTGSTGYGTLYEVITTWNIADQTVSTANNLSGFDKTNPTFGAVYATNWFRAYGDCGLYSQDYGGHIRRCTTSYGTWENFGYTKNGWGGFNQINNYYLNLMSNTSGDHGFFQENGKGWTLFYNRGNDCWGIGTDNTYSGDGFRVIKYGSAQYGWTTWSDRRAKENISNITGALDTVLAMRGVYFNYIQDEAKNKRVGFIAQELEQVLPEAVRYAEEIDEYSVEYAQIVSVLAEAIKEQNIKIQSLESQLQTLLN